MNGVAYFQVFLVEINISEEDDERKHIAIAEIFDDPGNVMEESGKKVVYTSTLNGKGFQTKFLKSFPEKYEFMGRGMSQKMYLKSGKFISIFLHF